MKHDRWNEPTKTTRTEVLGISWVDGRRLLLCSLSPPFFKILYCWGIRNDVIYYLTSVSGCSNHNNESGFFKNLKLLLGWHGGFIYLWVDNFSKMCYIEGWTEVMWLQLYRIKNMKISRWDCRLQPQLIFSGGAKTIKKMPGGPAQE